MTQVKDNEEQLTKYLNYLEQDPTNFNLLLSVCDSYRQLGDFSKAQQYLDKAKAIDSESCFALQGFIDFNKGNFSQAKDALRKALNKEDLAILRYSLALCHYSLDEITEGIEILSPLLAKGSANFDAELLMAKLLREQGRLNEAIQSLETTLERHGPSAETLASLAEIYFDCEETELAENAAEQALILAPDNYNARVVLLLLRLVEGKTKACEIEKLIAKEPMDARLWFALGSTELREMKLQEAEKSFLKAAELEPLFCDNWISLGWCQLFLNKLQEAKTSYQQALTINEESAEGLGGLALVASLKKDLADAELLIAKANKLDPHCFLATIAQIIYKGHSDLAGASKQFKETFPTIAEQLNKAMAIALANIDVESSTIH